MLEETGLKVVRLTGRHSTVDDLNVHRGKHRMPPVSVKRHPAFFVYNSMTTSNRTANDADLNLVVQESPSDYSFQSLIRALVRSRAS